MIAILAWSAIIAQYFLMIENKVVSIPATTLRFFSFFTILTNIIVATFFSLNFRKSKNRVSSKLDSSALVTSITLYITIVGLTYQVLLRHLWHPTGLQMLVDESLHSVIPVIAIFYWFMYANKSGLEYRQIPKWLIYPLVYLLYILMSGPFMEFYPYPFLDVSKFGMKQVLINSGGMVVLFVGFAVGLVWLGRVMAKKKNSL